MTEQNSPHIPWQGQTLGSQPQTLEPRPAITPPLPPRAGLPFQPPRELKQLEYHRLSHADSRTRWWSPLVEGLLGLVFYLIFSVIIAGLVMGIAGASQDHTVLDALTDLTRMQEAAVTSPLIFFMMFASIAVMFPSLLLARLILGPKPWGLVHSVRGRMRWGWLMISMGISLLTFVIVPATLALITGEELRLENQLSTTTLIWLLVLVFTLVPLQCYAEELVFRGYLMQTLGHWLKHPAWAIILPAPLFMLGHAYDLWGQLSILVMGLAAGFMVWYTGGLESAIAMHVVNNMYLMTMGVFGLVDPFAQEGSSFTDFLWASGIELVLVLLIMFAARKMGIVCKGEFQVAMSPRRWAEVQAQKQSLGQY